MTSATGRPQAANGGRQYLTPPAIAARLGVKPAKVIRWVRSGELAAVNVAERIGGRPRWRISAQALDDFLVARSCRPAVRAVQRRRQSTAVTEFF